jgi:hypothetical protein
MPEAFAVLVVFFVAIAAWIGAWAQARNPANYNARQESERLVAQAAWLEQRIALARRESWDGDMIANLEAELEIARRQSRHLALRSRVLSVPPER